MARIRTIKQEYQAAMQSVAMAKLTIQRAVVRCERDITAKEKAVCDQLKDIIVNLEAMAKETQG